MAERTPSRPGPLRRIVPATLLLVGILGTAGTVAGFFGRVWWGFDRAADWRLPLAVALLVTSVLYGVVFRRSLSALFLAAAVVDAIFLAPLALGTQPESAPGDVLRVVAFDAGGTPVDGRQMVDWLSGEGVDVAIVLRPGAAWTPPENDAGYRPVPVVPDRTGAPPPLILAADGTTVAARTPVPGSDVTVEVTRGTTDVTVVALAVDAPTSADAADRRLARFASVNAGVGEIEGPVVVTGNLETSRWSYAFGHVAAGLVDSEDGLGYTATWVPLALPGVGRFGGLPLDHALYRGAITVPYRVAGPDFGASHRPLLFDVAPAGS